MLQLIFAGVLEDVHPDLFREWWDDAVAYAREEAPGSPFAAVVPRPSWRDGGDRAPSHRDAVFHHYGFRFVGRRDPRGPVPGPRAVLLALARVPPRPRRSGSAPTCWGLRQRPVRLTSTRSTHARWRSSSTAPTRVRSGRSPRCGLIDGVTTNPSLYAVQAAACRLVDRLARADRRVARLRLHPGDRASTTPTAMMRQARWLARQSHAHHRQAADDGRGDRRAACGSSARTRRSGSRSRPSRRSRRRSSPARPGPTSSRCSTGRSTRSATRRSSSSVRCARSSTRAAYPTRILSCGRFPRGVGAYAAAGTHMVTAAGASTSRRVRAPLHRQAPRRLPRGLAPCVRGRDMADRVAGRGPTPGRPAWTCSASRGASRSSPAGPAGWVGRSRSRSPRPGPTSPSAICSRRRARRRPARSACSGVERRFGRVDVTSRAQIEAFLDAGRGRPGPRRHPRQQRGHRVRGHPDRGRPRRGLGPDHRRQPLQHVPRRPGGRPADDRARPGRRRSSTWARSRA